MQMSHYSFTYAKYMTITKREFERTEILDLEDVNRTFLFTLQVYNSKNQDSLNTILGFKNSIREFDNSRNQKSEKNPESKLFEI